MFCVLVFLLFCHIRLFLLWDENLILRLAVTDIYWLELVTFGCCMNDITLAHGSAMQRRHRGLLATRHPQMHEEDCNYLPKNILLLDNCAS
jgi:hypothetical protein